MDDIDSTIKSAGLADSFHIWGGQCLSIAKAIQSLFGGKVIVATEILEEGFDHALVEIEGKLYDGSGRVDWTETVNRFVAPEAQREDIDAHFYYPNDPVAQFESAFDPAVYESALQKLRNAR